MIKTNFSTNYLPVRNDSKAPAVNWAQYQKEIYRGQLGDRVGVVCGAVSDGLECLDFDCGGAAFEPWSALIDRDTLDRCYIEQTPSGGRHVLYRRRGEVPHNEKLALTKKDGRETVLIETRGEGGFCVVAPTDGYKTLSGTIDDLEPLDDISVDIMRRAARALNEIERVTRKPTQTTPTKTSRDSDDWEANFRASGELYSMICDALIARQWVKRLDDQDGGSYWAHPDCQDGGWHIHLYREGDVYAFSYGAKSLPFDREAYGALETLSILTDQNFASIKRAYFDRHPEKSQSRESELMKIDPNEIEENDGQETTKTPCLDADAIVKRLPSWFADAYKRAVRSQVKSQKGFALWSLLTAVGAAAGRRVASFDCFGDRVFVDTSLAGVVLGSSGTGKNTVKKILQKTLDNDALRPIVYSDLLSGQSLAERLFEDRRVVTVFDEVQDSVFKSGSNAGQNTLRAELKKALSDSESYGLPQGIASRSRVQEIAKNYDYNDTTRVYNPSTTAVFMGVPELVSEGITTEDINGGFAGRLFYCNEDNDSRVNFAPNAAGRLDFSETDFGRFIYNLSSVGVVGKLAGFGQCKRIDFDENGKEIKGARAHEPEAADLDRVIVGEYSDEAYTFLTDAIEWMETKAVNDQAYSTIAPVLKRQRELLVKIAFIVSLIETFDAQKKTFTVTENAARIALDLVKSSLNVLAWLTRSRSTYDGETVESKGRNKVYNKVKKWIFDRKLETMTVSTLTAKYGGQLRKNPDLRSWVMTNLLNEGAIEVSVEGQNGGRAAKKFNVNRDVLKSLI